MAWAISTGYGCQCRYIIANGVSISSIWLIVGGQIANTKSSIELIAWDRRGGRYGEETLYSTPTSGHSFSYKISYSEYMNKLNFNSERGMFDVEFLHLPESVVNVLLFRGISIEYSNCQPQNIHFTSMGYWYLSLISCADCIFAVKYVTSGSFSTATSVGRLFVVEALLNPL